MIDTKELRRLAQAATLGPWQIWHGWVATNIDSDGGTIIAERPIPSGGKYQARVDANFKFIAAANPAAISELLDRLEAAESSAAWHQRRWMALQMHQTKMREPERTIVCDILANGDLMHPAVAGNRYAVKDTQEK